MLWAKRGNRTSLYMEIRSIMISMSMICTVCVHAVRVLHMSSQCRQAGLASIPICASNEVLYCKNHAHHSLVSSYCHIHPLSSSATIQWWYTAIQNRKHLRRIHCKRTKKVIIYVHASGIHIADRSMELTKHVPNEQHLPNYELC